MLSSVLNQGSRLLRCPAVRGAAVGRGAFRSGQQAQHQCQPTPLSAAAGTWTTVRVVGVHHRAFWDWSGAGSKGGDKGNAKGSGGAADNDGGGCGGGGNPRSDGKKPGGSSENWGHPRTLVYEALPISYVQREYRWVEMMFNRPPRKGTALRLYSTSNIAIVVGTLLCVCCSSKRPAKQGALRLSATMVVSIATCNTAVFRAALCRL